MTTGKTIRKADEVEGRTISLAIYIKLLPPGEVKVGGTDAAMEIGQGLIEETVAVLKRAAEREGFQVRVHVGQVMY